MNTQNAEQELIRVLIKQKEQLEIKLDLIAKQLRVLVNKR